MWGWKAVERLIESGLTFEEGKRRILEMGFGLHISNPSHAVFKRSGTTNPWTNIAPDGKDVPIELALAQSHSGLYLQLRYDTFVAFDTGDLNRCADEIVAALVEGT